MKGVKMENMEHHVPEFEWLGIHFDASALMMIGITTIIVLILAIAGASRASVTNPSKFRTSWNGRLSL